MSAPLHPASRRTWRAEVLACLALGWPLILTNAIEMAMNLISTVMIGRVSSEALAAATLAMSLYNLCLLFGIGVTAAVSALVAREAGRSTEGTSALRRIAQQGFWAAALMSGPMWLLLWNADAILVALGQDPVLAAEAASYMHVLQWALLPAFVYLVLRSVFAALEHPRWAVATGSAAVALNALLNWLLIGGHGGLPALGLAGSGLATLLSNVFLAAALGTVAALDPRFARLRLSAGLFRPAWTGFAALWRLGLPIGVSLLLETGMFSVAAVMIGRFDAASLAAHAIALQVAALTFMMPLGLAQAATVRVGRASGAADALGIRRAGWAALGLGIAIMTVSAAVLICAPHPIIGLFVDRAEPGSRAVETIAATLLAVAGLFQIADGAQVVLAGMLRGLGDVRAPMLIAGVGYWGIGLPLAALLAFALDLRATGVWIGMTAGLFTVATLLLLRWRQRLGRLAAQPDAAAHRREALAGRAA